MSKQWVRQQIHKDPVQDAVDLSVRWVELNPAMAAWAGAGIVAAILVVAFILSRRHTVRDEAWDKLSVAEAMAYSGQPDAALGEIKNLVADEGSSPAASFGQVFAGDVDYSRANYKDAVDQYNAVLSRGKPASLQPVAMSDTAISQEAAGQFQQAQQTAQQFLSQYPDHFLAPQVHACLARCFAALGQLDQAKTTYQKIALQYPETGFAAWAQAQLQAAK